MTAIEIANAKLTLHLHVTGVREDGYHLIESEMVSLDLSDELSFVEGDGLTVEGGGELSPGRDNLVSRALRSVERTAQVRLVKRIPIGGGLGGGSSDAAAVLRWAHVYDVQVAASLGADVPFCVRGGRARVGGIGDELTPLPFVATQYTLLLPPFGVNTAAVYRAFDDTAAARTNSLTVANDLEAAALVVEPRLAAWRDRVREWTGCEPVLAGSGSTWFVEGHHDAPEPHALEGARWILARTVPQVR